MEINANSCVRRGRPPGPCSKFPIEYAIYQGMKRRCSDEEHISYKNYGGRGIQVCDRWLYGIEDKTGFECFIEDMGRRPDSQLSLDRINNDGDYAPDNCRWATRSIQQKNQRPRALTHGYAFEQKGWEKQVYLKPHLKNRIQGWKPE